MKRLLAATLCLLLGLAGAPAAELRTMPLHEEPQPVPDITFLDDAGASLTLDAWRGRIVLLNVWATWCVPCRAEMPTLDRLQAELGGERFEVVALPVDRAGSVRFAGSSTRSASEPCASSSIEAARQHAISGSSGSRRPS